MSLLTPAELEEQVETDLPNTALQQIIDSVEQDIDDRIGPTAAHVSEYGPNLDNVLRLPVPMSAITGVTEYLGAQSDPEKTALSADDYELSDNGWTLRRLSDGTNPGGYWGWHVVVTATPVADNERRKQVAIALARLDITHSGYSASSIGDCSSTAKDWRVERNKILGRLRGVLMA